MDTLPFWSIDVDQVSGAAALAWASSAGDVDGDGLGDVVVGFFGYSNGQTNEGRAAVYYGSEEPPLVGPDWTNEIDQAGAFFGSAVAAAGDVDADGFDDVIVGAHHASGGQSAEGRAYVYRGSENGLIPEPYWFGEGNQLGATFGYSVAGAGDVNGDGRADVIVGAPARDDDTGAINSGAAYVYYGPLDGAPDEWDWLVEGHQPLGLLGTLVATAGDVEGDGFDEVLVGARGFDGPEQSEGLLLLYRGSIAGPDAEYAWFAQGDEEDATLGFSAHTAGDVDGDGYDDVVVGVPNHVAEGWGRGKVLLYRGTETGLSSDAESVVGDEDWLQLGFSVAAAGDVDGDGLGDIVAGAPDSGNAQPEEGLAVIYHGFVPGRWYVDVDATGANDGHSWSDAFTDLQSALAAATPGDEIWVAEGSYRPTATLDRTRSFVLKNGVAIYGGFAGTEVQLEQRDPASHPTILTGDLRSNDGPNFANYADNSYHVVQATGVNLSAVLDGFVVRGGNANGPGSSNRGGVSTLRPEVLSS